MVIFGKNWKRIQKLAYVYFYSGGIYGAWILGSKFALYAMALVTIMVIIAFIINVVKKGTDNKSEINRDGDSTIA